MTVRELVEKLKAYAHQGGSPDNKEAVALANVSAEYLKLVLADSLDEKPVQKEILGHWSDMMNILRGTERAGRTDMDARDKLLQRYEQSFDVRPRQWTDSDETLHLFFLATLVDWPFQKYVLLELRKHLNWGEYVDR